MKKENDSYKEMNKKITVLDSINVQLSEKLSPCRDFSEKILIGLMVTVKLATPEDLSVVFKNLYDKKKLKEI